MSAKLKQAVESITHAGYQLEAEAFELLQILQNEQSFNSIISESLRQAEEQQPKAVVITREIVEKALARVVRAKEVSVAASTKRAVTPLAKDVSSELAIFRDTEDFSSGTIDDFNKHFKDRFVKLSNILHERLDFREARPIAYALEAKQGEKVKMTAIVIGKRERSNQLSLEIEDFESAATVMVFPQRNRDIYETARKILLDQVVGIEAVRGRGDLFIAERIVMPDVPEKRAAGTEWPINAVLLSDIHAGSRTFCADAFERLIMWLNGKIGNARQTDAAFRTKYVLIAGDLVDGVGVYPHQEGDLVITDVYEQYRLVARYIEQIPDYIEVVVIPGNHDAVRQALPQPPIPREFAEPVYEARRIVSLGNPSEIGLHGIHFLLYHGRSLDDVIARVPNLSMRAPEKAMEYLLRCRHLAPEYGGRTSLAPESKDRLIISKPPDVFQAGHIHIAKSSVYRGIVVVNCGSWQNQTEYQRRMGVEPTPGLMPLLNLQTMELSMVDFISNVSTFSQKQGTS
ncbi:DNA-directed DNA polymerase II small subunit [Candidatus Bathyarchaeota archaeon]|nr:DNA-directed DNA polymerase II small subunit [Candidatus Bathyarchaeota archaeon]